MVRTWIRSPLAVLADGDAAGGIVVEGDRIAECLAAGAAPAAPCDRTFGVECSREGRNVAASSVE